MDIAWLGFIKDAHPRLDGPSIALRAEPTFTGGIRYHGVRGIDLIKFMVLVRRASPSRQIMVLIFPP